MEKLLPCPFCGKSASKVWERGRYGKFGYIECDQCGARSRTKKIEDQEIFDTLDDFWEQTAFTVLIQRWNARANGGETDG